MKTNTEQDFWKQTKQVKGACLNWCGFIDPKGYGTFSYKGKNWRAHRLAYTFKNGSILKGLMICHACDNRKCVNPKHLWAGTAEDNMQDALIKGRLNHGERNHSSKLTEKTVKEARAYAACKGATHQGKPVNWGLKKLADKYGVSEGVMKKAIRGETWKHIPLAATLGDRQ